MYNKKPRKLSFSKIFLVFHVKIDVSFYPTKEMSILFITLPLEHCQFFHKKTITKKITI